MVSLTIRYDYDVWRTIARKKWLEKCEENANKTKLFPSFNTKVSNLPLFEHPSLNHDFLLEHIVKEAMKAPELKILDLHLGATARFIICFHAWRNSFASPKLLLRVAFLTDVFNWKGVQKIFPEWFIGRDKNNKIVYCLCCLVSPDLILNWIFVPRESSLIDLL